MESEWERTASGRSPERELDQVRRMAARPHLDYPQPPAWSWPVLGVAAFAYTWSFSLSQPFPGLLVLLAAIALCWWLVAWITQSRGVFPSFSTMPAALKREAISTWVQVAVLALAVVVLGQLAGAVAASITAGVAFTVLMVAHQRRHDAVAARVRAADAQL